MEQKEPRQGIEKEVNNSVKSEEEMLRNNLKNERYFSSGNISLLILLGAVVVVAFMISTVSRIFGGNSFSITKVFNFGFFIIAIIGFILLRKYGQFHNKNKAQYDRLIIEKAVRELLPGASIQPEMFVNADQLYRLGVVPFFNNTKGSYLLQYSKNGQLCSLSNLTLEYETKSEDTVGQTRTVFDGQAYILAYKSRIPGHVRIMSTYKTSVTRQERLAGYRKLADNEHKIELENQLFNESFDVYATDEESAFYVLTPYVMEQLLMMRKRYGYFGMAVNGNEIAIALNSGYRLFEMPYQHDKIDNISVENSKMELHNILNFAQGIEDSINGRIRGAE